MIILIHIIYIYGTPPQRPKEVVVSNIFNFHPENWGFMIQFDEPIFRWVGKNHQPVYFQSLKVQGDEQ